MVKRVSPEAIHERRERAAKLFAAGIPRAEIARRCGVSRQTAMRWQRMFDEGGSTALLPRKRGRPTKLRDAQQQALQTALLRGPAAHGWSTDLWTVERITTLIRRLFGVRYHPGHVWRLMGAMGWTLQRPTTRAKERDEAAIAEWKSSQWPRLKKTAAGKPASSSSTKAGFPKGA